MWQDFYFSSYQQPLLLELAIVASASWIWLRTNGWPRWMGLGLSALSALDAFFSSNYAAAFLPTGWPTVLSLVFVVLGDLRYLILAFPGRLLAWWRLALALVAAFFVPIFAHSMHSASGATDNRWLYLSYEILFLFWPLTLLYLGYQRQIPDAFFSAHLLVILYYALWALSDVLILTGLDIGFLLRILPNLLYYAALPLLLAHCLQRTPRGFRFSAGQ